MGDSETLLKEAQARREAESRPIRLTEPEKPPAANEILLCMRCAATYRVLQVNHNGTMLLLPSRDREADASAEVPWCPACGTMAERDRGATFYRPIPTRKDLRAALAEALDGWDTEHRLRGTIRLTEDGGPDPRSRELRAKLLGGGK